MRSFRLSSDLDALVKRAAEVENSSISEFARRALAERAERTLAGRTSAREQLTDVIGIVTSDGGRASRAHQNFAELLAEDRSQN